MILLIDNYDSFTWNLYQYFCELGADVLVRRNDELTLAQIDALSPQKIVISPVFIQQGLNVINNVLWGYIFRKT